MAYSIKYKHKGASTEYNLYIAGDQDYCLTSGKLSVEMGKAGELNIGIPIRNPAVKSIQCLTDEIIVYRDEVEIWRGRPITSQQDFELTGTLICEGVLAYLYDTVYPPFEFQGKPEELLKAVIDNHNSFVNNDKKLTLGNITVADKNDYINRSSVDYLKSIEVLSSRFVDSSLGGYFRVRVQGGVKYLDYLDDYASTATQNVEFGENILDLATEIEYGDSITAILPLGAADEETGEKITVKSVNGGDVYVRDSGLISSRGFIAEVVEWEDVTEPSNLLTKARNYLSQASTFIQTFTIKAIDLHFADEEIDAFNVGDAVRVVSQVHGVNQYSELYKMELDLLDPSNDSYEFGITRTNNSLVGRSASSQRNIKDSLSSLTVNFHKIAADYASIDYLSANYATIAHLEANYASIEKLEADEAYINEAIIKKADIVDLNASNAHITDLEADYANIATLLAGNAGVGDLQTIHLTSQNSVIDVAVIRNLLAQNITVNDLLAGNIITNKQRIISNDGSFVIDGSTQTIKDSNGNVRIQIGQDATGDFTFSLFDETGTGVLIDATGIKEDAIADGLIKNSMVSDNANIQATKLDIASLFTAMNADGVNTLYANKIWFDDQNQTLSQAYSQMSNSIITISNDVDGVESTANSAYSMAEAATRAADQATRALEGITSLDNLTAILSNDAHVVHTYYDGTGGDYTYAKTQVYAYKGDTDVTARAAITVYNVSNGLAGNWDAGTKTYQVTAMNVLNAYVDFEIAYSTQTGYLLLFDNGILMPNGKKLKINTGAAKVYKRFSISKSPDGMAGTNYNLQASVGVIRRSQDGLTLYPSTITFSALKVVGEIVSTYSGKYKIEETTNLSTWTQKYYSSSAEASKAYTPTVSAKMIRCTLMDESGTYLDSQTVTVIADADELSAAVTQAQAAIQTVSNRVGTVETGIDGLKVNLAETQSQLYGVAAGALLFQTPYTESNTAYTFDAHVYKEGAEIHTAYPSNWFQWFRKTEESTDKIGTGYRVSVNKSTLGYGGTIIGRFSTFDDAGLLTVYGNHLKMPNGNRLLIYSQPTMVFDVETNVYQDNAILNKFSALDTQFNVTLGKISAIVSESEITQYNSGSTMSSKLSAMELSLNGLYAQFSDMETTQEGTKSRVTQLEANVDGLSSSVVYTDNYTGEVIASLINQSASTVTISANHIVLTGSDIASRLNNSTASIDANRINLTAQGIVDKINSGSSTIGEAKIALTGANLVDKINASTATISANRIQLTASGIASTINNGSSTISEAKITLTGSNIVSKINSSTATISADRINLSGYVTVTNLKTAGATTINGGNITTGILNANLITSGKIQSKSGLVYFDLDNNEIACSQIISTATNSTTNKNTLFRIGLPEGKTSGNAYAFLYVKNYETYGMTFQTTQNGIGSISSKTLYLDASDGQARLQSNSSIRIATVSGANSAILTSNVTNNRWDITGGLRVSNDLRVSKTLTVSGTKNRIVNTDDYGNRLLYCYETPSPVFGDIGEGVIGEDNKCYVWLDAVFAETISTDQYQVFLQKYGEGDCYISERQPNYFVVSGTVGMLFGWELKAKQSEFDQYRLEKDMDITIHGSSIDYGAEAETYISSLKERRLSA